MSRTGEALDDMLGPAFARLRGIFHHRSLSERRDVISMMSQRGSNCDQMGAKGPKSPAENRQKNDSSLSRSSLKLSAPHSVLTWRVLVAELVPPPWREVAELFELAGLAAAGQGRGGCRGGSGGRRSVAHRASERERERVASLSSFFLFESEEQ